MIKEFIRGGFRVVRKKGALLFCDAPLPVLLANGIPGFMSLEELIALHKEALQLREGGTWVELGTWCGRSLLCVGRSIPLSAKLISVDQHSGEMDKGANYDAQGVARRVQGELQKEGRQVELITGEATEEADNAEDGSADVVFIDADHSYSAARSNILAWLPKLRPGGVMLGHDFSDAWPGVKRAVREMFGDDFKRVGGSIWKAKASDFKGEIMKGMECDRPEGLPLKEMEAEALKGIGIPASAFRKEKP